MTTNFLNKWSTLKSLSFLPNLYLSSIYHIPTSGPTPLLRCSQRLPKTSFRSSLMTSSSSLWPPCTVTTDRSLHQHSFYRHTSLSYNLICPLFALHFWMMKIGAHGKTWNHLQTYKKNLTISPLFPLSSHPHDVPKPGVYPSTKGSSMNLQTSVHI